jgi:hypothetical protein
VASCRIRRGARFPDDPHGRAGRPSAGGVSVEYALDLLFIAVATIASPTFYGAAVLGLFRISIELFRSRIELVPWTGAL